MLSTGISRQMLVGSRELLPNAYVKVDVGAQAGLADRDGLNESMVTGIVDRG